MNESGRTGMLTLSVASCHPTNTVGVAPAAERVFPTNCIVWHIYTSQSLLFWVPDAIQFFNLLQGSYVVVVVVDCYCVGELRREIEIVKRESLRLPAEA